MMLGVEIDLVVPDSLEALHWLEGVFEVERIEVSDFVKGQNEVVFSIYGTRFHLLDENPPYHLFAPKPDTPKTSWFNVTVPDIKETYQKVMTKGGKQIQAVTEMPEMGIANAMFEDPFGYIWMLHQINKVVDHEERTRILEQQGFQRKS
jgi:PhnB protein